MSLAAVTSDPKAAKNDLPFTKEDYPIQRTDRFSVFFSSIRE